MAETGQFDRANGNPVPELIPGAGTPEITNPSDPYRQGVTPEIPIYRNVEIPQRTPDMVPGTAAPEKQ